MVVFQQQIQGVQTYTDWCSTEESAVSTNFTTGSWCANEVIQTYD